MIIGGGVAATSIQVAAIKITGPHSCEGYAEGGAFCGIPTPYKVYFVAEFDADAESFGTWKEERLHANHTFAEGSHSGGVFYFSVERGGIRRCSIRSVFLMSRWRMPERI